MPAHHLRPTAIDRDLVDFLAIRAELGIPSGYPEDAVVDAGTQAERVAADLAVRPDATDLPLVTLDPPGARDLDQAMLLSRSPSGYTVHYAIADVAAYVRSGGPLDGETRRRGETLYCPDTNVPLHPRLLCEDATSLLPGELRAAVLWTIQLDAAAQPVSVEVRRVAVRSTAQLDYPSMQQAMQAGDLPEPIALLPEIGRLRSAAARRRGAITLNMPDAEVVSAGPGRWTLSLRAVTEIESYNAEISLLTGMCAARIMLDGGIGLLRTLPAPSPAAVAELRRSATGLGIRWPAGVEPGAVIAGIDAATGTGAAFLEDAVRLLRGAGYTSFDDALPPEQWHAGVGAEYAHVTAPLRRLADRFATEVCVALHAGTAVPDWARSALPDLPALMAASNRRAGELDRAVAWATVRFLLADRIGETLAGTVVQVDDKGRATVLLADPPVRAHGVGAAWREGERVTVRVSALDDDKRQVVVERPGTGLVNASVAG